MRALEFEPGVHQRGAHLVAQVGVVIDRRHREIAALVAGLVATVAAVLDSAGVPGTFDRVDVVEARVLAGLEAHVVEDVELRFRAEVDGVGDARRAQVLLGLGGHLARVAAVGLAGARLDDGETEIQRLRGAERIDEGGRRIRNQLHVRLVDRGESADRAAVEHHAFGEEVFGDARGRHVEMLLLAGQVGEPHVDELDALFLDEVQDFLRAGEHPSSVSSGGGPNLRIRGCLAVSRVFPRSFADVRSVPCLTTLTDRAGLCARRTTDSPLTKHAIRSGRHTSTRGG